jgi:hypothetical protein
MIPASCLDYLPRPPSPARPLIVRSIGEILANPHEPRWLVPDILEEGVLALLVGPRGSFKSFIALDWCMRVAASGDPVFLITPEGAGLSNRIAAWNKCHRNGESVKDVPVWAIETRADLNDPAGVRHLQNAIAERAIHPSIILVDTLSKNSGHLDENSNTEVKVFIGRLDTELRRPYGCTVLVVHHTGHTAPRRARGASALEADTDALYTVKRHGMTATVSRERFKDASELPPLRYEASVIDLSPTSATGKPISSLVLTRSESELNPPQSRGRNIIAGQAALRGWNPASGNALQISEAALGELLRAEGLNSKRRPEVVQSLLRTGVLKREGDGYSIERNLL